MSMTYRGWKWADGATEEQMEDLANKAACDRLADEARVIYDAIPDPRARYQDDDMHDPEFDTDEEYQAWREERRKAVRIQWGQLAAIEELLGARGGRFARDYEHWNEDEALVERMENPPDEEWDR